MDRTVIFDFDGTLALGRGPVDAYVREVVVSTADAAFAVEVSRGLDACEAGRSDHIDAYDVVRRVAQKHGVDLAVLNRAYLRSREVLATAEAPIEAPAGVVPFLERLGAVANLVLATNSPATRLQEALAALGIDHLLQARHTSIGKPQGLSALVSAALLHGPVLSVGDIYENDLAPAAALGAATALVGPTCTSFAARTTMAAATLPELYPLIEQWAGAANSARPTSR